MVNFKNLNECYIIAEAGINHNAEINLAFQLARIAKDSGADAVKFQLFNVKEQISSIALNAPYQQKGSGEESMIEMAKHYDLPWDAHIEIKKYCNEIGIDYLSSCFDNDAVDFLIDKLSANSIKISSGEITNLRLLEHASKKNVPIILSTGMATINEIDKAIDTINKNFRSTLILLQCTSVYPANENDINLNAINTLKEKYKLQIGYSDHTLGTNAAVAAIALGAKVIEKHFTIDKKLPGPDHSMALEPKELSNYVDIIRKTEKMLGDGKKIPTNEEEEMKKIFRRGLISTKKINIGDIIDTKNTSIKRPVLGIDAINFDDVVGSISLENIDSGTPIQWKMIKKKDE